MARTEKKTKIKGVPPRLALTITDSLQGSYPMVRTSVLSGNVLYNDANTIRFATSSIYFGLGLSTTSPYITTLSYLTGTLTGSGRVVAGVADNFMEFSGSSPNEPFRDDDQFAADRKGFGDPFWATGSSYEGLTAPLWSKNKVEIDFTPTTVSSLTGSQAAAAGVSSYVGYYDFAARKWQPLINVAAAGGEVDGAGTSYNELLWGFSASHNVKYQVLPTATTARGFLGRGRPMSTYGFPFSTRWEATSSNSIPVSNYITRPFLVEKIFVMMSASFSLSTRPGGLDDARDFNTDPFYNTPKISCSYVINNMFILNQRSGQVPRGLDLSINDPAYATTRKLNYNAASSVTRDLIGWFDIASFNNDFNFVASASANPQHFYRDVTIINSGITTATTSSWSQMLLMSGAAKSPKATPLAQSTTVLNQNYTVQKSFYQRSLGTFITAGWFGSRNGLLPTNVCGRDYVNAAGAFSGEALLDVDWSFQLGSSADDWARPNPYLLLPSDRLILGWQLPTNDDLIGAFNQSEGASTGSFIEFPVAHAKLVLYGSYVADEDGVNDTLDQVLSSNSIHEALK